MRVRLDKIASCTRNAKLHRDVVVGGPIPAVAGTVVAARVLDTKTVYNKIEDPYGRLVQVQEGDVIAGVPGRHGPLLLRELRLGRRKPALRGLLEKTSTWYGATGGSTTPTTPPLRGSRGP